MNDGNLDLRLLAAYTRMRKILLIAFAIPIELPDLSGGGPETQREGTHLAVVHAHTVIPDLPDSPDNRAAVVDHLILDWLDALIAIRLYKARIEPWYADIATKALDRFDETAGIIDYLLGEQE